MAETLKITILSPERIILDVKGVLSVRVKLRGDLRLSIYPGHAPLIAELLPGEFFYTKDQHQAGLELPSGIMQVTKNQITIFINDAQVLPSMEDSKRAAQFDNHARMLIQTLVAQNTEDSNPRN